MEPLGSYLIVLVQSSLTPTSGSSTTWEYMMMRMTRIV